MAFFHKQAGDEYTTLPEATPAPVPHPAAAPATISYKPGLIESLHGEHARLGFLYEQIGRRAEAWKYDAVRKLLGQFKTLLQAHILTENVHFYAWLERAAGTDAAGTQHFHEFRRSMNNLARQIVAFIDTWRTNDFAAPSARDAFMTDYRSIEPLVRQRIDSEEETLFPLYRPD